MKKQLSQLFIFSKARAFSIPLPRLTIRFSENFSPQQQTVFCRIEKETRSTSNLQFAKSGNFKTAPIELIAYDPLGLFRKKYQTGDSFQYHRPSPVL